VGVHGGWSAEGVPHALTLTLTCGPGAAQEYTAALQLVLPARYAATSGHARWGAALAAGAAAAQALLSDAAAAAMPSFEGAWALAPDQAPAAEAAADALADWHARVRALEEAGRAAAAMQGGSPCARAHAGDRRADAHPGSPACLRASPRACLLLCQRLWIARSGGAARGATVEEA